MGEGEGCVEKLKRIPLWIVDHPLTSLGLILLVTAFFALQIPRLEIDASAEGLMVEKDPARVYYEGIKKKFGSDNLSIVVIKAPDVFAPEVLGMIQRLSVALKNDLDQISDLLGYFDWALNEQCFQYDECDRLVPFINAGKAVMQVEYTLDPNQFCVRANAMNFNSMKKHLGLDAYRVPCR